MVAMRRKEEVVPIEVKEEDDDQEERKGSILIGFVKPQLQVRVLSACYLA